MLGACSATRSAILASCTATTAPPIADVLPQAAVQAVYVAAQGTEGIISPIKNVCCMHAYIHVVSCTDQCT
jgi:hypothetical protein